MAAGLGFIEFTTGDILTAAAANGYLASQTVMVFANAAARTAAITSPQEGMFSYLKDTNATEYYTGSAWAALGGGGGKVLQVIQTVTSTSLTTTSTSFVDVTNLTATITPSANTSKIYAMITMNTNIARAADISRFKLRLVRASTTVHTTDWNGFFINANTQSVSLQDQAAMNFLDSPATTSATTYKMQVAVENAGDTFKSNSDSGSSTITLMEIGA